MKFPTTTAEFVADQERRAGRQIQDGDLLECYGVWVQIFNQAFEDGRQKDIQALQSALKFIDEQRSKDISDRLKHWIDASRRWILIAWQQGASAV